MAETPSLQSKLAASLPKSHRFVIHHLSTPPTPCPAIYSAPPGQKPEKTYCESHFLSVSITHNDHQLQVFALEVLIYTTEHLTTLFVSKADSTGYIYLLNLPNGTSSPLKIISSIFVSHLVENRQRRDRQLVVSLFARAQDQYLFPGSIENPGKHVLDDRGLIKWWCRVLEPVLQSGTTPNHSHHSNRNWKSTAKAYLRVPSCDLHEHLSFFPPNVRRDPSLRERWHANHDPLLSLSRNPGAPERCLIPRFPDDPKSRFVDELDEELTDPPPPPEPSTIKAKESPSKGKRPGRWKSVRSLDQFWELMAFRQECCSGRLVGFLWGVFTPEDLETAPPAFKISPMLKPSSLLPTPDDSQNTAGSPILPSSPQTPASPSPKHSDNPMPPSPPSNNLKTLQPVKTKSYFSPPHTTGTIILPQKHYLRATKLMLHLDYANLDIAIESSKRWIDDVGMCAGRDGGWGIEVVGEMERLVAEGVAGIENGVGGNLGAGGDGANVLGLGLVRKKKRGGDEDGVGARGAEGVGGKVDAESHAGVNVLSTGLVRKKPKIK
ncbi:MAG: hypothetical protein Q9181_004107 [Wetmoreana brouardii]